MSQSEGTNRTRHPESSINHVWNDYLNHHIEVATFELRVKLEVGPLTSGDTLVCLLTLRVHSCGVFFFVPVASSFVPKELLEQAVVLEFAAVMKLWILEQVG